MTKNKEDTQFTLDRMQREDHDSLIRIETNLANLATDIKIMGDGLNSRIADHEIRLQKIETLINQTDPLENLKQFKILQQEVHDFKTSANAYRLIGGALGGAVLFILIQVPNWIKAIFYK